MTATQKKALIAALVAAVLVGAVLLWRWAFVKVEREIDLPPIGEAAYNPLYALKKTLENAGQKVESRQRLDLAQMALGPRDTVVMVGDGGQLGARDTEALLNWVSRGGHLVLTAPAFEAEATPAAQRTLLNRLGVATLDVPESCLLFAYRGKETMLFCGDARFAVANEASVTARLRDAADKGDVYARLRYGYGSADVVSDLSFMTNSGLDNEANAAFARQLLQPNYGAGAFHLIYRADMPPWWRLLLERGWPVWAPLLVALFAWLWSRMQRFGPLMPSPALARRSLVEHVRAAGEHAMRFGRGPVLYQAVRDAFDARLRRRDPLAAALSGQAQWEAIAARATMPITQVQEALQSPKAGDNADLRLRITLLIRLRNRL
ncbi:DUF4350 domain-containing protein [Luteimonas gilva]|uniref:DUF4350 domain-containing protein n=1 Tax=Luteimonas gilva TaxID=2572684 RepID=A0A4U5JP60_9GAMM|nr:DUF4350 domain-containing protein [Luteimonas gilva]TKR30341.1 DUF4350 domain-containing protein [Luteimonas gilva]